MSEVNLSIGAVQLRRLTIRDDIVIGRFGAILMGYGIDLKQIEGVFQPGKRILDKDIDIKFREERVHLSAKSILDDQHLIRHLEQAGHVLGYPPGESMFERVVSLVNSIWSKIVDIAGDIDQESRLERALYSLLATLTGRPLDEVRQLTRDDLYAFAFALLQEEQAQSPLFANCLQRIQVIAAQVKILLSTVFGLSQSAGEQGASQSGNQEQGSAGPIGGMSDGGGTTSLPPQLPEEQATPPLS